MDQNVVYFNIKGLHMHQIFVVELFEFHGLVLGLVGLALVWPNLYGHEAVIWLSV